MRARTSHRTAWAVALVATGVAAAALAADRLIGTDPRLGYKWGLVMSLALLVAFIAVVVAAGGPLQRLGRRAAADAVTPGTTSRDPVVLAIAALSLTAQLLYAFTVEPLFDQDGYRQLGLDFAEFWRSAELAATMRTPGYPLFLAAHYELGLGDAGVKVTQALIMTGGLLAVASLAGLGAGRIAARAAAVLLALYLPLWSYSAVGMTETVSICATVGAALAATLALRGGRRRLLVPVCGLLLAIAAIVRPNTVLSAVVIGAVLVLMAGGVRRGAATAALLVIAVLVVFAPWMARNVSHDVGLRPFGTNGDYPLALGLHLPYDDDIGQYSPVARSYRFFTGTRPDGFTPEAAKASRPFEELRRNVRERPAELAWSRAVAQFQMWAWPVTARIVSQRPDPVPYPLLMALHLLIIGAGAAGLLALRRSPIGAIGLGCAGILALNHLFYWTTPRYALPVMPFLIVGAGIAVALLRAHRAGDADPTAVRAPTSTAASRTASMTR